MGIIVVIVLKGKVQSIYQLFGQSRRHVVKRCLIALKRSLPPAQIIRYPPGQHARQSGFKLFVKIFVAVERNRRVDIVELVITGINRSDINVALPFRVVSEFLRIQVLLQIILDRTSLNRILGASHAEMLRLDARIRIRRLRKTAH